MTLSRRGFTIVELVVVMAMVAVIMASATTAIGAAERRARIQKATAEVKNVTQAILGCENYARGEGDNEFRLPLMNRREADADALSFLLGTGQDAESGGKVPVLLMAALQNGRRMVDPWGTPYLVTIKESTFTPKFETASGSMQTGFFLPNFYRLTEDER